MPSPASPSSPVTTGDIPMVAGLREQIGDPICQHTGNLRRVKRNQIIAAVSITIALGLWIGACFGFRILLGLGLMPMLLGMTMLYDANASNWRVIVGTLGVARIVGNRVNWVMRYEHLAEIRSYAMIFNLPRPGAGAGTTIGQINTIRMLGDHARATARNVAIESELHVVSPTLLMIRSAVMENLATVLNARLERGSQFVWGPWRLTLQGIAAPNGRVVPWAAIRSTAIDTVNAERVVLQIEGDVEGRLALLAAADAARSSRDTSAPPADPWLWIGAANCDVGLLILARRTGLPPISLPYLAIVARATGEPE